MDTRNENTARAQTALLYAVAVARAARAARRKTVNQKVELNVLTLRQQWEGLFPDGGKTRTTTTNALGARALAKRLGRGEEIGELMSRPHRGGSPGVRISELLDSLTESWSRERSDDHDMTKYTLDVEGESLVISVQSESTWDYGFADCWCWESCSHDCEDEE